MKGPRGKVRGAAGRRAHADSTPCSRCTLTLVHFSRRWQSGALGMGGEGSFLITPHISGPSRQGRPFPESLAAGSSELRGTSWSITGRKAAGAPGPASPPQEPQNIQDKRLRSPLAFN